MLLGLQVMILQFTPFNQYQDFGVEKLADQFFSDNKVMSHLGFYIKISVN